MIDNLYTLNETINNVANRALDHVAEHSQNGQMYLSHDYFQDLISKEDFLQYGEFIANELSVRPEVLEPVNFVEGELDINMGLVYLRAYQWCPGDEDIFGCSFDEWLIKPAEPVHHPMSLSRLAELGSNAITHAIRGETKKLTTEALGLTPDEFVELTVLEKDAVPSWEYRPNDDLRVGKWRVHIADTGERHGTFNHLINNDKPIVEFYDMTHVDPQFSPNGQFTTGIFRVETLLDKNNSGFDVCSSGLSLQGDCPQWTVSPAEMKIVISYLESFNCWKRAKQPLNILIAQAQQKSSSPHGKNTHTLGKDAPHH